MFRCIFGRLFNFIFISNPEKKYKRAIKTKFKRFFKKHKYRFYDNNRLFGFKKGDMQPRIEFLRSSYDSNYIDVALIKDISALQYGINILTAANTRYFPDKKVTIIRSTFSKFIWNHATQIECHGFENERIREYCSKQTLYFIDNFLVSKEDFTEGMDIILEIAAGDLFVKAVRGFKQINYRSSTSSTSILPTFENYRGSHKVITTTIYFSNKTDFKYELNFLRGIVENAFSTWMD